MSILNTRQICLFSASFFQNQNDHFSHPDPSTALNLDLLAVTEPTPVMGSGAIFPDLRLGDGPFYPGVGQPVRHWTNSLQPTSRTAKSASIASRELHAPMPWSLACLSSQAIGGAK
jgi:hypothetical protein